MGSDGGQESGRWEHECGWEKSFLNSAFSARELSSTPLTQSNVSGAEVLMRPAEHIIGAGDGVGLGGCLVRLWEKG